MVVPSERCHDTRVIPDTPGPCPRATLLVVDDDDAVREVIEEYFAVHGYLTLGAADALQARDHVADAAIDLAVIDINLPGEDGLSLTRFLRERVPAIGIVLLTSADGIVDRIVGLEVGADDYLGKPFDPRELLARVRSVMRRTSLAGRVELGAERVRIGHCVLDLGARRLRDRQGHEVPLTPLEFDLLKALAERPGRVLSRDQILTLSGSRDWAPFDRSVDLRIMRLRRKIEPEPDRPRYIRTVRHGGYVFVPTGDT